MSDGFWKFSNAKVPDFHHYFNSKDTEGCQLSCLSNCSCTAYANVTGIECLVWTGDLVDLHKFSTSWGDLFIRLAHSELLGQKKKEGLNWALRNNIVQCIARGLSYLHLDSRLRVIHRDLKASNILLDHDMNPKISDFGLARTFQPMQNSANTLRLAGTLYYMSPEYAMTGKFSEKSDVYSYGVLTLEIVSGRKSNSFSNSYESNEDVSIVHYAWRYWSSGEGLGMVDKSLAYNDAHSDEILRCIHVGLLCTQDNPSDRPTMSKVVLMLSSEIPLPEPKQSSFFPQTPSSTSTSDRGDISSTNELTISDVTGR